MLFIVRVKRLSTGFVFLVAVSLISQLTSRIQV